MMEIEDTFDPTGDDRVKWKNGSLELSVEQVNETPSVIPYTPHIVNCPAADPADRFDGFNTANRKTTMRTHAPSSFEELSPTERNCLELLLIHGAGTSS